MSHEIELFLAARKADQLSALLVAMKSVPGALDSTDMNTLLTLAADLAGETATWLLEEDARRGAAEVTP